MQSTQIKNVLQHQKCIMFSKIQNCSLRSPYTRLLNLPDSELEKYELDCRKVGK